jgi:hypothetical protein
MNSNTKIKSAMEHTSITFKEVSDFMPTEFQYATEAGHTVLGVIQQISEDIDRTAAEVKAKKIFGDGAELHGEGDDIDGSVHWLVIQSVSA